LGEIHGVYEALAESLTYCLNKYGARLPAYILMPSHLHLLLVVRGADLSDFVRDFKKYTAQKALSERGVTAVPVWQTGFDRQVVYSEAVFRTKLEYIHRNPVKAGLVSTPELWPWSSAGDYLTDGPGPVPIWRDWGF